MTIKADRLNRSAVFLARILKMAGNPGIKVQASRIRVTKLIDDRYEIIESLGSGGGGSVYLCRDRQIGRNVAVKILHPADYDATTMRRFRREAQALHGCEHPDIARFYSFGVDSSANTPYFVMEPVKGRSLANIISESGPLAPERARKLFAGLLEALQYAHERNVVHRDVKPSNLILSGENGDERLVMIDFGLARFDAPDSQKVTRTDAVIGTPLYMSPEQFVNAQVDARSDLFSLGCTLYEAVTGQSPFVGSSLEIIDLHKSDFLENAPQEFAEFLRKCLTTDAADRFQTAAEARNALLDPTYRSSLGTAGGAKRKKLRKLAPLVVACALIASVTTYTAVHLIQHPQARVDLIPDNGANNAKQAQLQALSDRATELHVAGKDEMAYQVAGEVLDFAGADWKSASKAKLRAYEIRQMVFVNRHNPQPRKEIEQALQENIAARKLLPEIPETDSEKVRFLLHAAILQQQLGNAADSEREFDKFLSASKPENTELKWYRQYAELLAPRNQRKSVEVLAQGVEAADKQRAGGWRKGRETVHFMITTTALLAPACLGDQKRCNALSSMLEGWFNSPTADDHSKNRLRFIVCAGLLAGDKEPDRAVGLLRKGIEFQEHTGINDDAVLTAWSRILRLTRMHKRLEQPEDVSKALQIAELWKSKNPNGAVIVYEMVSRHYFADNNKTKAVALVASTASAFREAADRCSDDNLKQKNLYAAFYLTSLLAEYEWLMGNRDKALSLINECRKLAEQVRHPELRKNTQLVFSRIRRWCPAAIGKTI